jgi:hypothetical protein
MIHFILKESVLNDDLLILSDKNKVFKGNYIAIVKQYSFLNAWCNKETIKLFRSKKSLFKFLDKNYNDLDFLDFTGTNLEN